jgi:hypothetical protein
MAEEEPAACEVLPYIPADDCNDGTANFITAAKTTTKITVQMAKVIVNDKSPRCLLKNELLPILFDECLPFLIICLIFTGDHLLQEHLKSASRKLVILKTVGKRPRRLGVVFGGGRWIRTIEVIRQQIYSLPPLATRESPHKLELVDGLEPPTC